jgi:Sigma-70 factor, region 1.1
MMGARATPTRCPGRQGYLTYAQVNERLPLAIVHPEKIEEIVEQLKRSGIRIVPG